MVDNVADAPGLTRARAPALPTAAIPHKGLPERESFDARLSAGCATPASSSSALAGFMRILSPWFPARWQDRMINIHPSLLPAFPGLHVQQQALAAGVRSAAAPCIS